MIELACKITAKVREESKKLIKPGAKYLEVVEWIENRIKELGAFPAFPVNISVNSIAAHDTAKVDDDREINSGDVVKIDLGAHVNGWPGDTAYTIEVDSDKHSLLISTTKKALDIVSPLIKEGTPVSLIGEKIEQTLKENNFNPIRNLGGHPLSQYKLHGDFMIPNYNNNSTRKIKGFVAVEPFATTGQGFVVEDREVLIYSLIDPRPIRDPIARGMLKYIIKYYNSLPFAERWIANKFKHYEYGLRKLLRENIIKGFPILKEVSGHVVAQFEHSFDSKSGIILTQGP